MSDATQRRAFRTIVADPPWRQALGGSWKARKDKARPQNKYPTMDLDAIKALKVPSAKKAHLYLWVVSQHIDWGYDVARAWGFEPIITLTWAKPGLGCGRFQCNTEHVLVCRKGSRHGNPFGSGGRHAPATHGTHFAWPKRKHSQKPDEFFDLVEQVSPGPYLEMFARVKRPGWSVWGNEVDCDVDIRRGDQP